MTSLLISFSFIFLIFSPVFKLMYPWYAYDLPFCYLYLNGIGFSEPAMGTKLRYECGCWHGREGPGWSFMLTVLTTLWLLSSPVPRNNSFFEYGSFISLIPCVVLPPAPNPLFLQTEDPPLFTSVSALIGDKDFELQIITLRFEKCVFAGIFWEMPLRVSFLHISLASTCFQLLLAAFKYILEFADDVSSLTLQKTVYMEQLGFLTRWNTHSIWVFFVREISRNLHVDSEISVTYYWRRGKV